MQTDSHFDRRCFFFVFGRLLENLFLSPFPFSSLSLCSLISIQCEWISSLNDEHFIGIKIENILLAKYGVVWHTHKKTRDTKMGTILIYAFLIGHNLGWRFLLHYEKLQMCAYYSNDAAFVCHCVRACVPLIWMAFEPINSFRFPSNWKGIVVVVHAQFLLQIYRSYLRHSGCTWHPTNKSKVFWLLLWIRLLSNILLN